MWLDYIGKFHPVVVHLPIGALLFTLLMVLLALKQYTTYSKAIKLGLVFSFFGALVSSSLGYVLYRSGGYEATAVQSHLILGWVSTASLAVLWYLFERVAFHRVFFPLFMMSTLAIGLTGHFGGQLTHGEEYFALPTPAPPPARVNLDSIQLYSQAVAQIFDKKCVSCHNFSKRKGGLALHQPQAMLEGGERGLPFEMNNATESRIITYAQLPIEDDLHMPPQGRPQLTSSEIQLLSYWIDQGATFDTSASMETFPEEVQTAITQFLPKELPDVGPLKISALEALQAAQFRVSSHLADTPFIQAKFEGKTINRSVLMALDAAAEQIVVLELPKMELPQNFWPQLKKLTNLQKLRLDGTNIQDAQLTHLTELPLRSLNLVGTPITAAGISPLLQHPTLEFLYAWDTKIETAAQEKLQEQTPIKLVFGVFEGFAAPQRLKPPQLTTEKTLFDKVLSVDFYNKVKGNVIRYTLDGSTPDSTSAVYENSIPIAKSLTLKARSFKQGWLPSEVFTEDFFKVRKKVENYTMLTRPSNRYSGVHKLFDFEEGTLNFADGKWLGFSGNDLVFTTKISKQEAVNNVTVSCMESIGGWIIYPKRFSVYARNASTDFKRIAKYDYRPEKIPTENTKKSFTVAVDTEGFTELKVVVENIGKLPSWHPAAGEDAWLFVDEVLFW